MKTARVLAAVAVAGICTVSLTGCFGAAGAARNPAKSAENYLHAFSDHDTETLCKLSADERGPLPEDGSRWQKCLNGYNLLLGFGGSDVGDLANARVKSAEINGDQATVGEDQITGVLDLDLTLGLTRYDGKWYVTDMK